MAALSDSNFLAIAPEIASHFVQAEIVHFANSEREEAIAWLRGGPKPGWRGSPQKLRWCRPLTWRSG
jgi:hypothetical protein